MAKVTTRPAAPAPPPPTGDAAFLPSDQRRQNRPPKGRHHPFILAHRPDAWEVSSGRIVPALSRYIVRAGVNGTDAVRDRRGRAVGVDPSLLRANLQSWQKREIPHDVDGPGTSYMTQPFPGHYVDRWTRLYEGTSRVSYDTVAYDEWRESLVTRGTIEGPRLPALEALEQKISAARDALADRVGALPAQMQTGSQRELGRLTSALKVVREAIEALDDDALGTPIDGSGTEASV